MEKLIVISFSVVNLYMRLVYPVEIGEVWISLNLLQWMGFVAFHTTDSVQGNINTPSLWAVCVNEVIEQSQTVINLYLQKDIHVAVWTFKFIKVILA